MKQEEGNYERAQEKATYDEWYDLPLHFVSGIEPSREQLKAFWRRAKERAEDRAIRRNSLALALLLVPGWGWNDKLESK